MQEAGQPQAGDLALTIKAAVQDFIKGGHPQTGPSCQRQHAQDRLNRQTTASKPEILAGGTVEKEETWITCVIPDLLQEHQGYFDGPQKLSAEKVAAGFERQTKIRPTRCRWASPQPGCSTSTLVLSLTSENASQLPSFAHLYGYHHKIIKKTQRAQIVQCEKCWDFHHHARDCKREPRCRKCGAREHTEGDPTCHKSVQETCDCPDRCTNCQGPHPADDPGCPIRPSVKDGVIQRRSKLQKKDIRRAQHAAYQAKLSLSKCPNALKTNTTTPNTLATSPSTQSMSGSPPRGPTNTAAKHNPTTKPINPAKNSFTSLNEEELQSSLLHTHNAGQRGKSW